MDISFSNFCLLATGEKKKEAGSSLFVGLLSSWQDGFLHTRHLHLDALSFLSQHYFFLLLHTHTLRHKTILYLFHFFSHSCFPLPRGEEDHQTRLPFDPLAVRTSDSSTALTFSPFNTKKLWFSTKLTPFYLYYFHILSLMSRILYIYIFTFYIPFSFFYIKKKKKSCSYSTRPFFSFFSFQKQSNGGKNNSITPRGYEDTGLVEAFCAYCTLKRMSIDL